MLSWCYYFDSLFFFFKQKTAYEMLISEWSSDVCSSDLLARARRADDGDGAARPDLEAHLFQDRPARIVAEAHPLEGDAALGDMEGGSIRPVLDLHAHAQQREHGLHVEQRLADLAIDGAEDIERHVELDHKNGRASCTERVCQYV